MKNTEWDAALIREAVQTSGKPLEVRCAQAFLRAGWKARLGSHFSGDGLGADRELDVLAEKTTPTPGPSGMIFRVRALVSCRGFRPEQSPFVYSVSASCVPSFVPRLLSSHRARQPFLAAGSTTGPIDQFETSGAAQFLKATELEGSRPVVAFDMVERTETIARPKKAATVEYERCGDRNLFPAIDSSTKAAFFWVQEDYQTQDPLFFATLNVPVCVLSVPFWEACIDSGDVAMPSIRTRAYQSSSFPSNPSSREVTTVVFAVDQITDLVKGLDDLFTWFCEEMAKITGEAP